MPDSYAHYRFGKQVLEQLPEQIRSVILSERELYDIGLHGPDILFFYRPLGRNFVRALGGEMHAASGKRFFSGAAKTLLSHGGAAPDLAYLYGFLCHFALDSTCHGYINTLHASGAATHEEIESSFDRMLLLMDGLHPVRTNRAGHLQATRRNAAVIAPYYDRLRPGTIREAIRGMVLVSRLFAPASARERRVTEGLMKRAGKYESLHGHIVTDQPNLRCAESDRELMKLYEEAIPLAVSLISGFSDCAGGRTPWPDRYLYNFEGDRLHW